MALWQLFQRPFDASPDSDIPKNVPFTLVKSNDTIVGGERVEG